MSKENRSEWVAVDAEFTSTTGSGDKKDRVVKAFEFFQRDVNEEVKKEFIAEHGKFEVGKFSKFVRNRWNALDSSKRAYYEELERADRDRYSQESHAKDVAAIARRERLQSERATLLLDDEGGDRRSTRGRWKKKQRKRERREQNEHRQEQRKKKGFGEENDEDDDDFVDDDNESSDSYEDDSEEDSDNSFDSDGSDRPKKKAKRKQTTRPRRPQSQKQIENRERMRQQKKETDDYIAERQEDLKKEKAAQAKRRLEFLLKQSNIFSHFGAVKQDSAKYGIKASAAAKADGNANLSRRQSAEMEDTEQDLDEADEHQATFLTSQPSTLAFGTMRQYQLEGLNWMIRLQENGVNGILADEMGLGKTLQSISILLYMFEYQNCTGPHLIVVPKSTLSNWLKELARWTPSLKPVQFHGDKKTREEIASNILRPGQRDEERTWHVCVTTYEVCNIEKNVLNKFAWSYLIIDEAHRLKNASTFSRTVRTFETRYRLLLTGTPLQNSLHELWALLNFLVPDVFASADQFDEWFNLDIEDDDEKNRLISQLHKILRPFMLRRLKKEVEASLPPKHETILFTGMSAMQKKLYRDILIRDLDAIQGKSGNRTAILNIVMQLRKCAGHPYLFPGVEDRSLPPLGEHLVENCGKMVLLDKLLRRLRERGHRVLLFTQMTRLLDLMEDYLVMRRFPYCRIDGNTSYEQREDFIESFNAPDSEKFIFLLSTRAGGLGINLQTADVVILYDSDWNPQADLQAQDRAHRIGQKREVQVFRFVTEHTIEEKIVERAQQKLKLDAMVVQQGRLKEKDKLSREELMEAVRFGADKIFKSKDSTISDEDVDMILDAGKRKTQELNEKLQAADKGDLLDFKLDGGGSLQTFEGVDYSNSALVAAAKAEAELLTIIDMGKRERRTVANYNENKLYQQQMAAVKGGVVKERKKKKTIRLPKYLRLPRMEEFQMFDQERLAAIQEEEETNFRALPEEMQKMATMKKQDTTEDPTQAASDDRKEAEHNSIPAGPVELPPLISDEVKAEKERLLSEGFVEWQRAHYSLFVKASARYGRSNISKIALEVGKAEAEVQKYANAFWGDIGQKRFSEHERDRVVKLIEKGEKKIGEIKALERGTRILLSLFDNPWEELEFTHVTTKDNRYTPENDRYLLCWTHKYGYGQWGAVKMAVRRSPKFRFDYFLRSLPIDIMGKRCEQLMRAAEKEVEHLERKFREDAGLPFEPEEGCELSTVSLPSFRVMQRQRLLAKKEENDREKQHLEQKVESIEVQIKELQDRLKELNKDVPDEQKENRSKGPLRKRSRIVDEPKEAEPIEPQVDESRGAIGPDGDFVEFPEYNGSDLPKEPKKAYHLFCAGTRREVKASLDSSERKNKELVHDLLRKRWEELQDEEKLVWRKWGVWDKKRYKRDRLIYEAKSGGDGGPDDTMEAVHVPKKRASSSDRTDTCTPFTPIPKKSRRT